jgi:putative oxidoreductase
MGTETDGSLWSRIIRPAWRSRAVFFIRLAVGLVFSTQGLLKFIDPNMGVNRFARIGFSHPAFTAHFVGAFEMVCGFLILIGLVICTAIATTKVPELARPNQGFWFMVSDARTDFSMLMCLLLLLVAGAGSWSVDSHLGDSISAAEKNR